ncbi:unnamed protein product, partial [Chrysoparadoxa australica]
MGKGPKSEERKSLTLAVDKVDEEVAAELASKRTSPNPEAKGWQNVMRRASIKALLQPLRQTDWETECGTSYGKAVRESLEEGCAGAEGDDEEDQDDALAKEGLGDNFRQSPWVKPSVELAKAARVKSMLAGGKAEFCAVTTQDFLHLAEGLGLYFIWLWNLLLFALGASLLTVPALMMNASSAGLDEDEVDLFRLSYLSAGNHHRINITERLSPTMLYCAEEGITSVTTLGQATVDCSEWLFSLWGGTHGLLTAERGSMVIAALDFAVILLFLLTWRRISRLIRIARSEVHDCSI